MPNANNKDSDGCVIGCVVVVIIVIALVSWLIWSWISDGEATIDTDRAKVSKDLVIIDRPNDFSPGDREISPYHADGEVGVGSSKFLVSHQVEGVGCTLNAFSQNCSISDLSWMMTQIYNQVLSEKIRSGASLTSMDIALTELALQVHSAYIHSATAQFFLGAFADRSDVKQLLKSYYLHCFGGSKYLDKMSTDTINTLCLRWYGSKGGRAAKTLGQCFSSCDHNWLYWMLDEIRKESSPDIRWKNLTEDKRPMFNRLFGDDGSKQMIDFDFDKSYDISFCWKEIHTSIYFESVSALRRINKEISMALSRVHDVDGYPELHELIEKWRPRMKSLIMYYSVAYSDLPTVVMCKAAYDQTKVGDKLFSTDRPLVRKIAQQYTRATSDGAMHQVAVSSTSGSMISQYHAYLKKLLGKDDYQSFINSIKWRKSDPLKEE